MLESQTTKAKMKLQISPVKSTSSLLGSASSKKLLRIKERNGSSQKDMLKAQSSHQSSFARLSAPLPEFATADLKRRRE